MRILLSAAACVALATPVAAEVVSGPARAIGGDSLNVDGREVRLFGIDAPEATQQCARNGEAWACGQEAAEQLAALVVAGPVTCQGDEVDQYGRLVAVCQAGRFDINRTVVEYGYAVAFREYSDAYVRYEQQARASSLGIWASTFDLPENYRLAQLRQVEEARPSRLARVDRPVQAAPTVLYFRNCAEARAAGAAPLYRGRPGYRPEMDGDRDGIACEPFRQR
jgi:endonuclease YncB( thermonuclease family)